MFVSHLNNNQINHESVEDVNDSQITEHVEEDIGDQEAPNTTKDLPDVFSLSAAKKAKSPSKVKLTDREKEERKFLIWMLNETVSNYRASFMGPPGSSQSTAQQQAMKAAMEAGIPNVIHNALFSYWSPVAMDLYFEITENNYKIPSK